MSLTVVCYLPPIDDPRRPTSPVLGEAWNSDRHLRDRGETRLLAWGRRAEVEVWKSSSGYWQWFEERASAGDERAVLLSTYSTGVRTLLWRFFEWQDKTLYGNERRLLPKMGLRCELMDAQDLLETLAAIAPQVLQRWVVHDGGTLAPDAKFVHPDVDVFRHHPLPLAYIDYVCGKTDRPLVMHGYAARLLIGGKAALQETRRRGLTPEALKPTPEGQRELEDYLISSEARKDEPRFGKERAWQTERLQGIWEWLTYRSQEEVGLNPLEQFAAPWAKAPDHLRAKIIKNNEVDVARQEAGHKTKDGLRIEIPEADLREAADGPQSLEEVAAAFGWWNESAADTFEHDTTPNLSELSLPLDPLTPTEVRLLEDVLQAMNEGYAFDSKRGMSFRRRWGKHYPKNIKAWNRLKRKLKGQ